MQRWARPGAGVPVLGCNAWGPNSPAPLVPTPTVERLGLVDPGGPQLSVAFAAGGGPNMLSVTPPSGWLFVI